MTRTSLGLGKDSRKRLSSVLRASKGTITVPRSAEVLNLPARKTALILARYARQGWISRVRRGLYIPVPLESKSFDIMPEDSWLIAMEAFAPCYIGGWSAAEYWQMTEQIFRSTLVMSSKKRSFRSVDIKGLPFQLRKISEKRFFGLKNVWRGPVKVPVSDPSRTLVDLLDDPSLGGGIRPTADVFGNYMNSSLKNIPELLAYAEQLGNATTFKRLGFLTETMFPQETGLIDSCKKRLSQGNSKLDPSIPCPRLVTRWRLWVPDNWKKERPDD
jgi:predicted transcriptional regulator of viral defense system